VPPLREGGSATASVRRIDRRAPEIVIAVVAAVLIAAGILLGGGSNSSEHGGTQPAAVLPSQARIDAIEREVERLRGLKFKTRVVPKVVTSDVARNDAISDLDRTYPARQRQADEELLTMLGLIPPGTDIKKLLEAVSGEQVIGYYDPRRKIMRIVSGNGADAPALVDITLAHELTHALEDQRFGLKEPASGTDDEASARTALLEGTASLVETRFAQCCVDRGALLTGSLGALGASGAAQKLPSYVERTLLFSYTAGERFVSQLYDATGNWALVNAALKSAPPVSTEQIIHPEKYVPFEPPLPVRLRMAPVLGSAWSRTSGGTLGELDTRELLRLGDIPASDAAAAGWGGGRYELWQRDGQAPPGCGKPCPARDALVLAWRWDTARDAREFEPVLREYVQKGLKGRPSGSDEWTVGGGSVAIARRPQATAIAWAPDAGLARRLAERAPVSAR
jgi:hypothetical protein